MNLLEIPEASRPDLETRERSADVVEYRCPCCGSWRPGFCIRSIAEFPEAVAHFGSEWVCDHDFTAVVREQFAEPQNPEPEGEAE